jgi:hypothetical protein
LADDKVGNAGLVFDGDEHDTFGRARPLTNQDEARRFQPLTVTGIHRITTGDDTISLPVSSRGSSSICRLSSNPVQSPLGPKG